VLVSKYADHCPLFRQSEIYAREGVDLDRSTLAGWVGASSELLAPLVEALRKHVLAASKIHADDTPVPVLAPGNGKTKTGRLWTYVRDERSAGQDTAPAVWFAYSPDRKGEHPRQHLKNFKGALQADAYAGFHHLYDSGDIYEVACWAHARRKFHDIHVVHASLASALCMASKKRFAARPPTFAARFVKPESNHCSTICGVGWKTPFDRFQLKARRQAQFDMRSRTGGRLRATSMMGCWRSTTRRQNGRFAPLRWVERITCLLVPTPAECGPPQSTLWSDRPS
jgi:hypothetical protein